MKKIISFSVMLLFVQFSFSQKVYHVDYNAIGKYVKKNSEAYLKLTERFEANDSLLTNDDYALLYYGYSFTPKYRGSMDRWNVLDTLYSKKKMDMMYDKAKEFRQNNPVSLKLLLYLIKVTSTLQKKAELQSYIEKYKNLVAAILSSGDGKTEQTPFYVICINDEYQLLQNVFDVKKINSQSLINGCDLMKFENSPYYNGTEIYFNISRSLDHLNKIFK